ncbi:MAG: hypothetical protein HZB82_01590 [Deltaproteobacteria bacterium]|nr:hypothetical protein [Deltaproteobacteria bacterium]
MCHRIIGAVSIAIIFMSAGCTNTLDKAIRSMGYTPIALASTAYQPGKLVRIVKNDPFQADTICEYGSYIGSPSLTKNKAASYDASQKLSSTLTFDADFLKQLQGRTGYSSITDIKVTLSNVSVEEIPDNIVYSGIHSQEPGCTQAILNIPDRKGLGFLQNALKADGTYNVIFAQTSNIKITTQQQILRDLAVELGLEYQNNSSNQISGKNLYWGVKPPNKELVLTPKTLRITRLQLLDESYVDRSGDKPVITKLVARPTTSFYYKNANDLIIAVIFTVEGYKTTDNLNVDIDEEVSIQALSKELTKTSLPHTPNVSNWEQMPNVKRVGLKAVKEYLHFPENLPFNSIPYVVLIDKFEQGEIPNKEGNLIISITDQNTNETIKKSLDIQMTHD